jgi:carbamoyl-phosphate synthase large subunit
VQILKILFTGGGGAGTEALWRLYENRYEIHIADADINTINPIVLPENRHEIPWASSSDFLEKISDICQKNNIDVLVPGVDEELYILALKADKLLPTKLMLPNVDFVETMLDKLLMAKCLEKKELSVPLTHSLDEDFSDISFPCIVKPRKGRGSRGVKVLTTRDEALVFKKTLGRAADTYVIQNKIVGQEYTVQMAADLNGKLLAIVPVKVGIKRGITIAAEVDDEKNVIEACQLIHQSYPTKGCYNIQLILTEDGAVMPFEINPRVSTTYCLVVAAGVDPIEIYLGKMASDKLISFNNGVQLKRHWHNYFST